MQACFEPVCVPVLSYSAPGDTTMVKNCSFSFLSFTPLTLHSP